MSGKSGTRFCRSAARARHVPPNREVTSTAILPDTTSRLLSLPFSRDSEMEQAVSTCQGFRWQAARLLLYHHGEPPSIYCRARKPTNSVAYMGIHRDRD